MQEKELNTQDKARLNLSVPMDVDQKFRQEAKKREVSISEMLVKLMDERDYFEKKLLEKEKIIENTTEIISKDIVESLSEIKNTNLILKMISGSLISIPQVTEEARKINERCTKSSQVIGNFNIILNDINKKMIQSKSEIENYNTHISSNTKGFESISTEILAARKTLNSFLADIKKVFDERKNSMLDDMKEKSNEMIKYQKEKLIDINELFNSKLKIMFGVIFFLTCLMSCSFLYGYFSNISKLKSDLSFQTTQNKEYHDFVCKYRPPVPGFNYKTFCGT